MIQDALHLYRQMNISWYNMAAPLLRAISSVACACRVIRIVCDDFTGVFWTFPWRVDRLHTRTVWHVQGSIGPP